MQPDESRRFRPMRPVLLDLTVRAEDDPGTDEAYFLAQLRAVVAARETQADRLFARYRGRPSGQARFYAYRT
jgi:gamma-glutamylcysteine synthetase